MKTKVFENDEEGKILNRIPLLSGGENISLVVELKRVNPKNSISVNMKKLNKKKNYSWFLIAGNLNENRIFGIKKFIFNKKVTKKLLIQLPRQLASTQTIELFLMSDSFIGID